MKTEANNNDTPAVAIIPEVPTEVQSDNAERLAQLATKIRTAYAERHKCEGKVENWKAKQLKAGIELGECLSEAKTLVPGKQFMAWCRDNFPELCHRTLNRYMKIAVNKCETHVSKAGGLRQAYKGCSRKRPKSDASGKSAFQTDAGIIKGHLTKAKNLLNNHADIMPCEDADAVCDLVDALNIWVSDYRAMADRHALIKHRDTEFEMSVTDEQQTPLAPQNREIVVVE